MAHLAIEETYESEARVLDDQIAIMQVQNNELSQKLEADRPTSASNGHRYQDVKAQLHLSQKVAFEASASLGASQKTRSLNFNSCGVGKCGGDLQQPIHSLL
jgi:hypothetical protein